MSFYVFDLDGTLANCQHRVEKYLKGDKPDWRAFFAACPDDTAINHVVDILMALKRRGDRIEIWSGRSDEVREQTSQWLENNHMDRDWLTHMRKAGDHRPDDIVKREFLATSDVRPDVIFDDRKRVVDMWRAEGIPCFQVADGDF